MAKVVIKNMVVNRYGKVPKSEFEFRLKHFYNMKITNESSSRIRNT